MEQKAKPKKRSLKPENRSTLTKATREEIRAIANGKHSDQLVYLLRLAALPQIDWHNNDDIKNRCIEYFQICTEEDRTPTISGLAQALGTSRVVLSQIKNNVVRYNMGATECPFGVDKEGRMIINWAFSVLESNWEQDFLEGKINPATGIFYSKNNFGYTDTTQQVVEHIETDRIDVDAIKRRYIQNEVSNPKRISSKD